MFAGTLERAVLETLAYSDVFEHPLRLDEIHRYLPKQAKIEQVSRLLSRLHDQVGNKDGLYFLSGREKNIEIRRQREIISQKLLPYALQYGRIMGTFPFIRMVALTGSLAVMNASKNTDFDYMLVTVPGRVWTARAFALLLNRYARLFGQTLCPNLILSENALKWTRHDLYSARELCQMIPITGFDVYEKLMKVNEWVKDFLPNVRLSLRAPSVANGRSNPQHESQNPTMSGGTSSGSALLARMGRLFELILRGKLGDRIEQWEMNRKIARFSKQDGFGEETIFNADICQGNFGHHGKWTMDSYEEKLSALAVVHSGEMEDEQSPGTAIGALLQ